MKCLEYKNDIRVNGSLNSLSFDPFLYVCLKSRTYYGNAVGGGIQLCPVHISYMHGGILVLLHRHVFHHET